MHHQIQHSLRIKASQSAVMGGVKAFDKWWVPTVGEVEVDGELSFHFGEHIVHATVQRSEAHALVLTFTKANPEWVGTQVSFDVQPDGDGSLLRFGHEDWRENTPLLAHCSMKWATFLLSLRALVEHGEGRPFPSDIPV